MVLDVRALQTRRSATPAGHLFVACAVALAALPAAAANAERGGIGLLSSSEIGKLAGKQKPQKGTTAAATTAAVPVSVDPRKSLIITDAAIVPAFPILTVLNTLAAGSPSSMIARQLYDQWMDLHNLAPGIGTGGHCNDEMTNGVPTLNGFQFDCPRAEGRLVGTNPTDGNASSSFQAVAVVNRFDLATDPRLGGTDCGEYRIVYAKKSALTNNQDRMQIIFEGVLPNPAPNGKDLSGCRPVAQFWADLSNLTDPIDRVNRVKSFFFIGLPGFEPVVKASHYGFATPAASGQIRANLFMQFNWALREYRLAIVNSRLKMLAVANHQQAPGQLFNETDPHPKGADFRTNFLDAVATLAVNDINTFNENAVASTFDAGDGDQQSATKSNYAVQFSSSPNFAAAIQQRLTAVGSSLTPQQIVERATAMSCAGCHQLSNGKNLGGGLIWPSSLGFTHISETLRDTSPEGQSRFKISPALIDVFLPRRKTVLESFLNGQ